jgi:hypothetical protein
VPKDADIVYGMFLIDSIPASVLFDSGASHSFITESFMEKHNIPKHPLKKMLHISSPGGDMKATHSCLHVNHTRKVPRAIEMYLNTWEEFIP